MIRFLYKKFRLQFLNLLVEELLADVPDKVQAQAIELIAEKKSKFQKLLLYQAHHLQRRDVSDYKNRDVVFGQLIYIKAMLHLVNQTRAVEEGKSAEEIKPASTLEDDLERVKNFKERKVPVKSGK
jgi:hypothetical protein